MVRHRSKQRAGDREPLLQDSFMSRTLFPREARASVPASLASYRYALSRLFFATTKPVELRGYLLILDPSQKRLLWTLV